MNLSFNDPNLTGKIFRRIKQKLEENEDLRSTAIARHVYGLLTQAYSSPETIASYYYVQDYLVQNQVAEAELAPLNEVIRHISVSENEIIIDTEDPLVSRTIRALELYGNAPLKNLKDKLAVLGFNTIRGL